MKGFRHILLMVAMLVLAMPCAHGFHHDHHESNDASSAAFSAVHSCACSSCDADTGCVDPVEMPLVLTPALAVAPEPSGLIQLFILEESRPIPARVPPTAPDPLLGLRTIQLLI